MPPKKRNTRAAQLQPQPTAMAQSDYDTDTANFTDNTSGIPTKPPPTRTNTELNLLVLQRYSPEVERIIQIAHFAVVYTFSTETEGWEKTGLEGTMFLCQLSGASYPRYSVIVLNRKSLDNFIVELDSAEQVQVTEEYVMLQVVPQDDGAPQVYGLWIFSEEGIKPTTLEVMAMAMQECAVRAEEGKRIAGSSDEEDEESEEEYEEEATFEQPYGLDGTSDPAPIPFQAAPQQPSGQQIDLLKLFGQAQVQPETHIPTPEPLQVPAPSATVSQPRFASNADTDFFRTSRSPAVTPQAQQPPAPAQPQTQQSALLSLFKNARRV